MVLAERLRAAGLPVRRDAAPLDLVAEVLAEIRGDPAEQTRLIRLGASLSDTFAGLGVGAAG